MTIIISNLHFLREDDCTETNCCDCEAQREGDKALCRMEGQALHNRRRVWLEEGWSGLKGVVFHVQPATEEMKKLIAKDKFIHEKDLIPVAEAESGFPYCTL